MFNILPLILVLISLAVIISIIVKKFPQLSNIRTETIQREKETQTKRKILDDRLKRKVSAASKKIFLLFSAAVSKATDSLKDTKEKLEDQKDELGKRLMPEMLVTKEDHDKKEEIIEQELEEAEELLKEDEFEKAEKKYIEIITADQKNVDAYEGLAELYFEQRMYKEAKETLLFVLSIDRDSALAYTQLAEIEQISGTIEKALSYIASAVEIEPRNPKFLHLQITLALVAKNKMLAQKTLKALREVNPENAKLDDLQEEINEI